MRKILLTILITLAFPQSQKIDVDIEKVLALRSEISRDIIQILPDGSQTELGRCGFVELGNADRTFTNEEIQEWVRNNPASRDLSIPIAFHVIYASNGTGNLPESAVNDQVDVLNSSYAQWGLSFTLSSLDYTQNSSWFNNDSESQYKAQLAISPSTTLNIYTTTAGGYLGYAYLPQDYNESSYMHGVVLNYQSLPNVYNWEYDEGDTGVHEVGHYLGLYHTFQGSCTGNGDYVDDTPAQYDGDNIYNCWNMDTCTSPGNDPIYNYMNYTDDACITEFTSGQSDRIAYMVETYKPSLGTQEGCAGGYVDDCSGDGDCCAESWIGDGYGDCEDQAYGCDLTCYNNDGSDCTSAVEGCTDGSACNYNPDATENDGSCEYYNPEIMCDCAGSFLDINGDCCSELMMDECWVCNGDGPAEHYDCDGNCLVELDCAGNCCVIGEDGCYWQETGPCGEPGPSNGMDECGVCGGDNSSCMTCAGVPCSDAYVDNCGVCDDDPSNDCVQGCDGGWGSGMELDECGVCDGDGSSCADADNDGCLDNIDDAPYEWDDDYDGDGLPDDCDADDDNDGVADYDDSNDNNEYVCSDVDGDTCDDCSFGMFDPYNDGPDYNENGICDQGDNNDTDGDGVIDEEDSDPFNPYQCSDNDGDGCDDCGLGYYNPADDGSDYDVDGLCDLGDADDDNDGVIDSEDCHPFDPSLSEYDCCGVCGGDNATCSNCCGIPFNDDCTSDCYEDENTGDCCLIGEVDECGICYGDGSSCQSLGDLNGDGAINVIDIVITVDLILSNSYDELGDVNEDGLLNVLDVVMLIDWVLNGLPNDTVTDIDGNTYETVQIGDQLWMAENLKVTHYKNGDEIQYVQQESSEPDVWENLSTGAYGYFDDDPTHQVTYGNLYNWFAVDDSRGVCPEGWHVPSDEEYTVLTDYLGEHSVAGGKMKEAGLDHWNSPNTGATNESGFTGLPAGYRYSINGHYNYTTIVGNTGFFWSSSEGNSSNAWTRYLSYGFSDVHRSGTNRRYGLSVRCLGD